jgi:hypothetical protein
VTQCACDACELREHLERRLAILEKIVPLNETLRSAQWHRLTELQLALDKAPTPYEAFHGPMAARHKLID